MNQDTTIAIIYSLIAGLSIEVFFQLIKYRDAFNKDGPRPVTSYGIAIEPSNYLSVAQYLSGGERRWLNYFLFRLLPPGIVFILLAGSITEYLQISNILPYLFIAALFSLIPRDITRLFMTHSISERLLHITNIILVIFLVIPVAVLSSQIDLSFVAPTTQGLVDNLWSSLIIALLVILYLQATNMNTRYQDQAAQDTELSNYVVRSYTNIRNKHDGIIQESCAKYSCSQAILYAVLIYEDMNRPSSVRKLENALVKFFHLRLTVGIAQVHSNIPLTDQQSIREAAKILKGTVLPHDELGNHFSYPQWLEVVLHKYNPDKNYAKSVSQILDKLMLYAPELYK